MIQLDPASPVPLYLQICDQLRRLIALGALLPGERIPTVRELAAQSRVNRNTAARAIQHLEGEGLVRTRVGRGTFVERKPPKSEGAEGERRFDQRIDRMLIEAQTLGLSLEDLQRRVAARIVQFKASREEGSRGRAVADTLEEKE